MAALPVASAVECAGRVMTPRDARRTASSEDLEHADPPREIYLTDPAKVAPADNVTDVVWPIAAVTTP